MVLEDYSLRLTFCKIQGDLDHIVDRALFNFATALVIVPTKLLIILKWTHGRVECASFSASQNFSLSPQWRNST